MKTKNHSKEIPALKIETETKWYKRLWYLISNPFLYIFKGKYRL